VREVLHYSRVLLRQSLKGYINRITEKSADLSLSSVF